MLDDLGEDVTGVALLAQPLRAFPAHPLEHPDCLGVLAPGDMGVGYVQPVAGGDEFATVLAAAQDGSEAAFAALWRDSNPALLRFLRVAVPDAAEDVAAETWVQVVRGLPGFRGDEQHWRAWLFTIARRRAIDEGRRRSRHPVVPLAEVPGAQEPRAQDAAGLAMQTFLPRRRSRRCRHCRRSRRR